MSDKHCRTCDTTKPLAQFWRGQTACIVCSKDKQKNRWQSRTPKKRLEQHLKYKYGITHAEFSATWSEQNGCCAICTDQLPDLMAYDNRRRGYAIDHNHETGAFRGVLCINCNSLLGMARDSVDILAAAADYLNSKGSYGNIVSIKAAARKKGK